MTIAWAATFPWGKLRKLVTSLPGGSLPGGLILATDSRWSVGGQSIGDAGRKLWRLAPEMGIGAVFSGDVLAAEEALDSLTHQLRRPSRITTNDIGNMASETLAKVYKAHLKRRAPPPSEGLHVLVGVWHREMESNVIRFTNTTGFAPLYVVGPQLIGSPTGIERVMKKLPDIEDALLPQRGSVSLDITEWAIHVAAQIRNAVIDSEEETTIGGGIQIATISEDGWSEPQMDVTSNPSDPDAWKKVTAAHDEVKVWRGEHDVPPLARNTGSPP